MEKATRAFRGWSNLVVYLHSWDLSIRGVEQQTEISDQILLVKSVLKECKQEDYTILFNASSFFLISLSKNHLVTAFLVFLSYRFTYMRRTPGQFHILTLSTKNLFYSPMLIMNDQSHVWWMVSKIIEFRNNVKRHNQITDKILFLCILSIIIIIFEQCPSGLKPGQRKVLFTCLKRNDKREVKVAQLAGSVAELSAYHHGEVYN